MSFVHFLELILVFVILIAIGIPLFLKKQPKRILFVERNRVEEEYQHLLVRKEETLLSIKDLELDFNTAKISN